MPTASETLERTFLEMRWRCLSLAADLDRVQRSPGGPDVMGSDPRLADLRQAVAVLLEPTVGRAERVQLILSDRTPLPGR